MKKLKEIEILQDFREKMSELNVPYYVIGSVRDRKHKPVIEIVVRRPERYNNPEIVKRISKIFKGLRVIIS